MNKEKISIYVVTRADLESELIKNSIFYPITCGSAFLEKENHQLRDDVGDNISLKSDWFCEFTAIYWVWKNKPSDFVGFCHYRRYFSFSDKKYPISEWGLVLEEFVSSELIKKYSILEEQMTKEIINYDVITACPVDVRNIPIDVRNRNVCYKNLKDYCQKKGDFYTSDLEILRQIVKEKYSDFVPYLDEYYDQPYSNWYNCFIMKWELFDQFCQFLFTILFEFEKRIDTSLYSSQRRRIVGFCGEHLYGIWLSYMRKNSKLKIKEKQLVFIRDTKEQAELFPAFNENNIPIVVTCSDFYAPYLSVFISSFIERGSPEKNYDLIVLVKGITEEFQRRIEGFVSAFPNLTIRFYNPKKMLSGLTFYVSSENYAEEANYRLLTPWVLKNYEKAIVTDIDLIFQEDPASLFEETNLGGKFIACCKDVVYQGMLNDQFADFLEYAKNVLKLKDPYAYVNTGVMVMNLKEIRKHFSLQAVLDFSRTNHFRIQEQDILNVLFQGKVDFLDISWNCYLPVNDWIYAQLYASPADSQQEYFHALKSPKVLHWASQPKPWNRPDLIFADCWWKLARTSPFYEVLLNRLQSNNISSTEIKKSLPRRVADVYLPPGSLRRKFAKKILPKGSKRWYFLKNIYHKYLDF